MAIRNRRGVYSDFDKTKMVDGEFAVVKSGDPDGSGKAVYISFESGTADRLALFDDLEEYGGKIDAITVNGGEELPIDDRTVDIPIPTVDISAPVGDIVEFSTGGDNMPMKAVEVFMSPIQDLNGYDSPWPAGGGKNLFDISTATVGRYINENGNAQSTTTTDWSVSDFIPVQANTTYTFTPNSTAGGSAKHGFYDSNKNFISVIASGPQTFTTPSNCAYVRVSFRTVSENVQLEKGSTATAWEPYANVCPITGRTGASVVVSGKNLLENTAGTVTSSGRTFTPDAEGKIAITGTATGNATYNLNSNAGIAAGQYIVDVSGLGTTAGGGGVYVAMDDGSATRLLNGVKDGSHEITATSPIGRVWLYLTTATGTISNKVTVQIRPASITDATYEPHQATTYPITFTSAGTVYAGTVDLVSGRLEVTHGMYTFASASDIYQWSTASTGAFSITSQTITDAPVVGSMSMISNQYKKCVSTVPAATEYAMRSVTGRIVIYDPRFTSRAVAEELIAANQIQVLYPLATPLTYNLTPTQVMSLLGENVVWSPDGTISKLEYSADISLVIADLYSKLSS